VTAAERALELLAGTVELPGLPLIQATAGCSRQEAYAAGYAHGLMVLLTRYRRALADLVAETVCVTCGAAGVDLVPGVAPGSVVCVDSRACEDRFTEQERR
jgi:hypothetical protein